MADEVKQAPKDLLAWYYGLDPKYEVFIDKTLPKCRIDKLVFDLEKLMTDEQTDIPSIIFCGKPTGPFGLDETAQTLRNCFPETPIFLIMDGSLAADRAKMVKNGFNDVFFLPLDEVVLQQKVGQLYSSLSGARKRYRAVKLMDMKADMELDFDTFIYLPMNNKHIKITGAKNKLKEEQITKLKQKNMDSLFISEDDMPKFYEYAATALRNLNADSTISETEKQERVRNSVRDIMSGFFSDESAGIEGGKKVAEDCRKIVQQYMSAGKISDIYQKILNVSSGEGDSYSHSMNVSAYAGLFAMTLGLTNIEDVSLAGLLHDIGKAKIPLEILQKDPALWTPDERKVYESHPELSISMIKEKKIVVSDTVLKMIAQHHERVDGSGFPKGPNCGKIALESQILAFANEFDEMMTVKPGQARKSPAEVVRYFHQMAAGNPTKAVLDPQHLKKILTIFPVEPTASPAA